MSQEKVLVLIKPDAMARRLFGIILYDLAHLDIKDDWFKISKC